MNKEEVDIEDIDQNKLWIRNYSFSILFHLLIVVIFMYFYGLQSDKARINYEFFTFDTKEYLNTDSKVKEELKINSEAEEQTIPEDQKNESEYEVKTISFSDIIADTTNLDQLYNEPTLNVSIKYPKGWTFIDQNKGEKLDGVTFWESDGLYNPPPYIHLEVVDKDMFIEKRYLYKMELEKYQAYYNDAEEMEGYVTLIVYVRTDDDEDFRLKLMIKGESEFKSFQPKFWAIVKSFKFGASFF